MTHITNRMRLAHYAAGLLLGVALNAQAQSPEELFQRGLDAVRSGQNRQALELFRQAREAGLESGALFFNLGVTHYQLQQYPQARAAFENLTGHPTLAPLAWYNLGLVALKTGDAGRALEAFTKARTEAGDPRLRALADKKIGELKGNSARQTPAKRWAGAVSLGAGRDDALQDPAEQVATEEADEFAELFALGSGVIAGAPGDGWRVDLSAYGIRYQSFDDFDMSVVNGTLTRMIPVGEWRFDAGVAGEQSTLAGEGYLREGQLRLSARLPEAPGVTGYRMRYRYHAIEPLDSAFDAQEGSRHDLDLEARWAGQAVRTALRYGLEMNDREDFSSGDLFTSYSPTRHAFGLLAFTDSGSWRWSGEVEYRFSDYEGTNVLADGRRIDREDERLRARLGVDYRLSPTWEIGADYSRTDNDSNVEENDYDQNLVSFGVTALF